MNPAAPLDLRELFAHPWQGTATVARPWWLRWFPVATTFAFRTEVSDLDQAETTGLTVHDTTTFPNGRTWQRTMNARLVGEGHWRITAADMPGGTDQHVTADGFRFSYTILAPVLGPLRVPLRCDDEVRLVDPDTMVDTLEMRFLGLRVGRVTMRLRRIGTGAA
ncbi:MAG: DUF3833 family protein [Nocardioidaceae bacterium]|nr:DUF3833 family protein [Nocardioidaceae bacterium]